MLAPYRPVLAVAGAPRLFASALIARLPQGMVSLAVLLLVRGTTHSYAAAGIAVGAEALAMAVSAPWLGRLIDRLGRERVMVRCAAGYGVALVALVVAAQARIGTVPVVVLASVPGLLLPPVAPVVRALMRDVFTESAVRERAYALESVSQELIWITGPMIVALLITLSSPSLALLLIAAEGVCGTLLFVRSPLAHDREREAGERVRRGAALSSPTLRLLLVPVALMGAALGATEVGIPALALHAGSKSATGILLALWSLGSLTGGLLYGARQWSAPLSSRYALLLLAAVLCTAPLLVARSLPAAVGASLLAGLAIAPVFSCQYALVGHSVTPGSETEAFTWVSAALISGVAAGSAAGGALVSAGLSAPFAFACAAMGLAAAMAVATRGVRTERAPVVGPLP